MKTSNPTISSPYGLTDRDYPLHEQRTKRNTAVWSVFPVIPEWLTASINSLRNLSKLDYDWDSYGAPPIDSNCIEIAQLFIEMVSQRFPPQPHIGPVPDGGVQIEWHRNGIDLEVEFSPDDEILFFLKRGNTVIERNLDFSSAVNETVRILDMLK